DTLDRAAATQPAQLPQQIGLRGDVEHHFGASQAPHDTARERFVAVDLLRVGDDDRMVVDVDAALTQARAQVGHAPGAIAFLDAPRGLCGLTNAAVDQPLETNLRIVVDVRASDVDVEQRRD